MEEEEKTGKITPGDKVIWDAEIEFMSPVSTPAVTDSEFLMIKEKARDPSKIMVKGHIPLLNRKSTFDEDNRMIYAPALLPDKADGNREAIPKEEIKKAAIKYMELYRKVDNEHTFMDGDGIPIFSWILQEDQTFTTMDSKEKTYPEGTWMMGIKVTSDKLWQMVKSGERTGFSIAGSWKVLEIKSKGPGGHTPDGTGPHGSGAGPGNGQGDGSGMDENDDEDDDDSKSSSEEEQSHEKVKPMEEEEFMKLFEKAYLKMKEKESLELSQKEADNQLAEMKARLEKAEKELETLRAQKDAKSDSTDDGKKADDEDEEEEEGEKQDEEEEEEEKEEFEDEDEEEEEEKKVEQKATKSYDSKIPSEKKPKATKQSKRITNATITVKKYPLGDDVHA